MVTIDKFGNHIIDLNAFKRQLDQNTVDIESPKDSTEFLERDGREFLNDRPTGKFIKSVHYDEDNKITIAYRDKKELEKYTIDRTNNAGYILFPTGEEFVRGRFTGKIIKSFHYDENNNLNIEYRKSET